MGHFHAIMDPMREDKLLMRRPKSLFALTVVLLAVVCWLLLRSEQAVLIDAATARDDSLVASDAARDLESSSEPDREVVGFERPKTPAAENAAPANWHQVAGDEHLRGSLLGATDGVIVVIADSSAAIRSSWPDNQGVTSQQMVVAVAPVASDGSFSIALPGAMSEQSYRVVAVTRDGIAIGDAFPNQPIVLYAPESGIVTLGVDFGPMIDTDARGSIDVFWAPDSSTPSRARASRLEYLRRVIEVESPAVLELANALCWRSVVDTDSRVITCPLPEGAAPTFGTSVPQALILRDSSGQLALRGIDDDTIERFREEYSGPDVYEFATSPLQCGLFPTGTFRCVREVLFEEEWTRDAEMDSLVILGGVGRIRAGGAPSGPAIYRFAVIDAFGARLVATPPQHTQGSAMPEPTIMARVAGEELVQYLGLSASIVSYRSVRCSPDPADRGKPAFVTSSAGLSVELARSMTACFAGDEQAGHSATLMLREVDTSGGSLANARAGRQWALVWSLPHRNYVILPEVALDDR
jgi:hypothetical protein